MFIGYHYADGKGVAGLDDPGAIRAAYEDAGKAKTLHSIYRLTQQAFYLLEHLFPPSERVLPKVEIGTDIKDVDLTAIFLEQV